MKNLYLNVVTFGAWGELRDRYASLLESNSLLRGTISYQDERIAELKAEAQKHLDTQVKRVDNTNIMATMTLPRTPRLLACFNRRNNDSTPNDATQRKFEKFHSENPHVYEHLVRLARKVKAAGKTKYSIWSLINQVRWHIEIETTGDTFKLSNDYSSRYSRLIMQQEPDLKGFFTTKQLKANR